MSAQQVNSAAERVPPPTPPTVQWEGDRSEGKIRVTVNSRSYFVTSTGANAAKMQEIFDTIQSNLDEAYTKFQSMGDPKALGDTLKNFKEAAAGNLICRYTPQGVAFYKPTDTNYKKHVYLMQRVNTAALQNLGLKVRSNEINAASAAQNFDVNKRYQSLFQNCNQRLDELRLLFKDDNGLNELESLQKALKALKNASDLLNSMNGPKVNLQIRGFCVQAELCLDELREKMSLKDLYSQNFASDHILNHRDFEGILNLATEELKAIKSIVPPDLQSALDPLNALPDLPAVKKNISSFSSKSKFPPHSSQHSSSSSSSIAANVQPVQSVQSRNQGPIPFQYEPVQLEASQDMLANPSHSLKGVVEYFSNMQSLINYQSEEAVIEVLTTSVGQLERVLQEGEEGLPSYKIKNEIRNTDAIPEFNKLLPKLERLSSQLDLFGIT